MYKIFIAFPAPEVCLEEYRDEAEFTVAEKILTQEEVIAASVGDYDGLYVTTTQVHKELLDKAGKIRVIGNLGVGYDNIDWKYAAEKKIVVVNTPTQVTETTAEHAVALMMATMRGLLRFDRKLRAGEWNVPLFPTENQELHGCTLGILGFGRIGKSVCKKAKGLGMNVIYYDKFRASEEVEKEYGVTYMEFDEVLANSDCITLHMPYTPENHHLMNKETFAKMKKGAYFVNAARGAVVDEEALVEALKSGALSGAGLDVFEHEPQVNKGLLEMDNVVLTPHAASATMGTRIGMTKEALKGMFAVLHGEKPVNAVNL